MTVKAGEEGKLGTLPGFLVMRQGQIYRTQSL